MRSPFARATGDGVQQEPPTLAATTGAAFDPLDTVAS
jgi:hypothetical protein